MRPFETLDSFTTPEGRKLTLHQRDGDLFIHLDGDELMSTRVHGSERALAELGCHKLPRPEKPVVLIGGLGLGFTLRAALAVLPPRARIVVAETFPCIVEWNQRHVVDYGRALEDARVRVIQQDVANLVAGSSPRHFDAILLDVDNSPDAWCLESNARLYTRRGLAQIKRTLVAGGTLAVWSAHPDPPFLKFLRTAGFEATAKTVRSRGRKGLRHTIFLARRHT